MLTKQNEDQSCFSEVSERCSHPVLFTSDSLRSACCVPLALKHAIWKGNVCYSSIAGTSVILGRGKM